MVFGIEGFECRTPLVVSPLIEPAGHRPLQAVDLGFQSGVPADMPPPPQPVLQAYFVLNTDRYRRPLVVTWATFGSRCRHGYNEVGCEGSVLGWNLVATAGTQLHDSLDMNVQGHQLLPDDALRNSLAQVLHREAHTEVLRKREGVKRHPLPQSRDRSALTASLNPLAVDETTISFPAFSWAVRPPG